MGHDILAKLLPWSQPSIGLRDRLREQRVGCGSRARLGSNDFDQVPATQ